MKKIFLSIAALLALTATAWAQSPFADVPETHWARDAVAQLAARGVISGGADGKFDGRRATTRYEMASAVARALAVVDMERASREDVELLKRLVVEFKDELDALGVRVDNIDKRLSVFERDLGGWSLSGQLRFDAKFSGSRGQDVFGVYYPLKGSNQFDLDQYRIFLRKRINDTTSFTARLGKGDALGNGRAPMRWDYYYITTKVGRDATLDVGSFELDWEYDLGLYIDDDAWFGDVNMSMFRYKRSWGRTRAEIVVGRRNDTTGLPVGYGYDELYPEDGIDGTRPEDFEQFVFAAMVEHTFSERLRAALMFYGQHSDHSEKTYPNGVEVDACLNTYGIYAEYKFTPAVALRGIYYRQELSEYQCDILQRLVNGPDARYKRYANFWRAILDIKQEALRFTSLWLEYGHMDNNFTRLGEPSPYGDFGSDIITNRQFNTRTSRIFGARADQRWNDKWRTFVKYLHIDYDTPGLDDAKQWAIGVAYRLNPAVEFELGYENVDFGNSWRGGAYNADTTKDTSESIVRLRTFVSF